MRGLVAFAAITLLASACTSGDPSDPDVAPVITVTGVEDQGVYTQPVTIGIAVDRGTYTALLNGFTVFVTTTVSDPGSYVLVVEARDGTAVSTVTIAFQITGPPGPIALVRLFDLGPIDSGGGGDAILISDSSAIGWRHGLIDAGPPNVAAADRVANRIGQLGIDTLAFALLTHAHEDHYGGMSAVVTGPEVLRFLYNGQVRTLASYTNMLAQAQNTAGTFEVVSDSVPMMLGATRLVVLPPLPDSIEIDTNSGSALNNGSLGVRLEHGGFDMFFTGDGEVRANQRWRTLFAAYTADLTALKAGHHGANDAVFDAGTSGPSTWLDHTDPGLVVISANGTTHPRIAALNRLLSRSNTRTYCTNVHGDITIRVFSNGTYATTVEKNADLDCEKGEDATT